MATLFINDNINFIGSSDTVSRVQRTMTAERNRIEREREDFAILMRLRETADRTNDPMDWALYSDFHKDIYGVRPW